MLIVIPPPQIKAPMENSQLYDPLESNGKSARKKVMIIFFHPLRHFIPTCSATTFQMKTRGTGNGHSPLSR
jgi:hypothetical protein